MGRRNTRPRKARSDEHRVAIRKSKKPETPKSWIALYVIAVVVFLVCLYHAAFLLDNDLSTFEKAARSYAKERANRKTPTPHVAPVVDLYLMNSRSS